MPTSKGRYTTGEIVSATGFPLHRVLKAIDSLGLVPVDHIRHYRLFDDKAVEQIGAKLSSGCGRGVSCATL